MDIPAEHDYAHVLGSGAVRRRLLWRRYPKTRPVKFWKGRIADARHYREVSSLKRCIFLNPANLSLSLLLLSEFHPRSMHFPPGDDDDDILAPAGDAITPADDQNLYMGSTWSEPAVRSDRMTWSLIGTSYVLAYELGIFGTYSDGVPSVDGLVKRKGGATTYNKRADRIERMLYVFITQASGRFGIPSMYSDQFNQFATESVKEGFVSGMWIVASFAAALIICKWTRL